MKAPVTHEVTPREGFLPIKTNAFDRGFIGVVLGIFLHLLWMRFLEQAIPLWVCTILAVAIGIYIIKRG
ncbi:DUF2160 family membrane protein [Geminicoccus roseus]|uniref:DUF2160 family membrane protein n=1 Tax=Geminicoccus roseus TaxID=404900 RepID=UPI0003F7E780|nr:DUF2160 family membrane protein [Geminicoccus roseus]